MQYVAESTEEFPLVFQRNVWSGEGRAVVFQVLTLGSPQFPDGLVFVAQLLVVQHGLGFVFVPVGSKGEIMLDMRDNITYER